MGDRVVVKGWEKGPDPYWEGRKGTVYLAEDQQAVCVEFEPQEGKASSGGFDAKHLERIEPKIEDFKLGQRVKVLEHNAVKGETAEVVGHYDKYVIARYRGNRYYFYPNEIEIIEEKETELTHTYKTGDRIEFVDYHDGKAVKGDTAVVTANEAPLDGWGGLAVKYKLDKNGVTGECFVHRVKLAPEFTFKDIETGDTIRRTMKYTDGTVITREGVVEILGHNRAGSKAGIAFSKDGVALGYSTDAGESNITLELINRPEKPKHWAHTKPVGAVGLHTDTSNALVAVFTKKKADTWQLRYLCNNNKITMTNAEVNRAWPTRKVEDLKWVR